jgi:hypothetical protein
MRKLNYLTFIFGVQPLSTSAIIFLFYEPARLAGLAVHTSSTVQSELLPRLENTTYMIVPCTQ